VWAKQVLADLHRIAVRRGDRRRGGLGRKCRRRGGRGEDGHLTTNQISNQFPEHDDGETGVGESPWRGSRPVASLSVLALSPLSSEPWGPS
jgi:hypothetical protein